MYLSLHRQPCLPTFIGNEIRTGFLVFLGWVLQNPLKDLESSLILPQQCRHTPRMVEFRFQAKIEPRAAVFHEARMRALHLPPCHTSNPSPVTQAGV